MHLWIILASSNLLLRRIFKFNDPNTTYHSLCTNSKQIYFSFIWPIYLSHSNKFTSSDWNSELFHLSLIYLFHSISEFLTCQLNKKRQKWQTACTKPVLWIVVLESIEWCFEKCLHDWCIDLFSWQCLMK